MSKPKELDLPLLLAVGTACTLAGILISKTTVLSPALALQPSFPPRASDAAKAASEYGSPRPTSPRARSRTMSSGNLMRARSSANLEGDQSVRLVVSDGASRNTVEALLLELAQLQARSADIKISGTGAFADVASLVTCVLMDAVNGLIMRSCTAVNGPCELVPIVTAH
jgi:hypothetical protein